MTLSNLKFLVSDDFETIETIFHDHYLQTVPKLTITSRSLINCYVVDIEKMSIIKIIDIERKGNRNPWWRFEFFNPMIKISLKTKIVEDKNTINKLLDSIKQYDAKAKINQGFSPVEPNLPR